MPEDKNKHTSPDNDSKLFQESMANVKPLSSDKRYLFDGKPKPKPTKKQFETQTNQLESTVIHKNDIQSDDVLFFSRGGLQHKVIQKLKRGALGIDDKVDLHGLNQHDATQLLNEFLDYQQQARSRCIIVVHGKGLGSLNNRPVLKNLTYHLLHEHPSVLAVSSAQPRDGGTGALYVLLKNPAK